eukprot:297891-Chlamydomonas_euryale.AAC.1
MLIVLNWQWLESRLPHVYAHGLTELLEKGMWLHALAQKLAAICIELSGRLLSHRAASVSRVATISRLQASGRTASGVLKACMECAACECDHRPTPRRTQNWTIYR